MESLANQLVKKRTELGLSVYKLAGLINVKKSNLYKWEEGTKPVGIDANNKIRLFLEGKFDQFVMAGKIVESYDYAEAMEIIYPRNPTNDFAHGDPVRNNNTLTTESINLELKQSNEILRERVVRMQDEIESLKYELAQAKQDLKKHKPPGHKIKNSGGRAS